MRSSIPVVRFDDFRDGEGIFDFPCVYPNKDIFFTKDFKTGTARDPKERLGGGLYTEEADCEEEIPKNIPSKKVEERSNLFKKNSSTPAGEVCRVKSEGTEFQQEATKLASPKSNQSFLANTKIPRQN
ncbi:hypothetical protein CYMTET_31945 [Cymbomonas tetramitiformis]|uniref:Uncharacterized protein n=1 Tax=Cymbomonas tetramitiformis TaxID=36881 RepID=A0AAE0KSF4_9CHLO|nr:hypothetical protein CYMTET_31945 [Cymbomonas tetramitiformis]